MNKADRITNLARIWEIIDGRSVPVLQVNLVDGSFLEMDHYPLLDTKVKIKLADAEAEYRRRFKGRRKKADAATSACKVKNIYKVIIAQIEGEQSE